MLFELFVLIVIDYYAAHTLLSNAVAISMINTSPSPLVGVLESFSKRTAVLPKAYWSHI